MDDASHIARDNPGRAVTFVREELESCQTLAEFPERFPIVARYETKSVRRRPHGEMRKREHPAAEKSRWTAGVSPQIACSSRRRSSTAAQGERDECQRQADAQPGKDIAGCPIQGRRASGGNVGDQTLDAGRRRVLHRQDTVVSVNVV
ncbi:MAG: hypothetical protein H7267_04695 [Sandarakinorhabdus sp.]|nr:hypothetical protein [Sandarakinorhabdus sp.]